MDIKVFTDHISNKLTLAESLPPEGSGNLREVLETVHTMQTIELAIAWPACRAGEGQTTEQVCPPRAPHPD